MSEINRSWARLAQMCLLHLSLVEQRSLAVHMLGQKWPKQPDFFEETLRLSALQNWQERAEKLPADLVLLKTNEQATDAAQNHYLLAAFGMSYSTALSLMQHLWPVAQCSTPEMLHDAYRRNQESVEATFRFFRLTIGPQLMLVQIAYAKDGTVRVGWPGCRLRLQGWSMV